MKGRSGETGLNRKLKLAFGSLIGPESVKVVRITHEGEDVVQGFILTHCPLEDLDHWKDFEVYLKPDDRDGISFVVVDGKRYEPGQAPLTRAR